MEKLYNYIFWYNHHESLWYAIERDSMLLFFNGHREESSYIKSKKHETLVELVCKGKDFVGNIK